MSKKKKQQNLPVWQIYLEGLAAALAVYLAGTMVVMGLTIGGILPEHSAYWGLVASAVAAGAFGGMLTCKRVHWKSILSGLLSALLLALLLIIVGLTGPGVDWAGEGGGLIAAILSGGLLAGLLNRKAVGKRHRKS